LLAQLVWSLVNKFSSFLYNTFQQNSYISTLVFLILDWFLVTLRITKFNESSNSDLDFYYYEWEKKIICNGFFWSFVDYFSFYLFSLSYRFNQKLNHSDFSIKLKQINNNTFYAFNNKVSVQSTTQTFLYGLRSVWKHLRLWILPITITLLFVYYSFFLRSLPFAKIFYIKFILYNLFYLLMTL